MLKKILLGLTLVLIVAVANQEGSKSYKSLDVQTENYILKLKLEIYELKSENSELKNIVEQLELNQSDVKKDDLERSKAIVKLKRELKLRKDM